MKHFIYKWIEDEKNHMAWEAQYLNYIEKLGYENFLAAMM
jgi:bacterioferritin (cytochrome b1)